MTEIAAHRGGAQLWPENSRNAFENITRMKVEQVEFDVHPTRDGRLVVIHDPTLDRTTTGSGAVAMHDWAHLARLHLKDTAAERILLLEEVIEIFRPTPIVLRLEIKCDAQGKPYAGLPERVADVLSRECMAARTVITSFQLATVAAAMRAARSTAGVWLLAPAVLRDIGGIDGALLLASQQPVPSLGIHHTALDGETVAKARRRGLGIGGWGCHTIETMMPMFALDVDVFTTDRPDLALSLRADHQKAGKKLEESHS